MLVRFEQLSWVLFTVACFERAIKCIGKDKSVYLLGYFQIVRFHESLVVCDLNDG